MDISNVIVPATMWLVGMAVAFFFPAKNILSVLGIVVASIGVALFIPEFFHKADGWGWVMVGMSIFYLCLSIQAYVRYCKLNKLEEDE